MYEGIRYPYSEDSYFTPGFSPSTPLRHATRIVGFDDEAGEYPKVSSDSPIVSETSELTWHYSEQKKGLVTVETEKSQALIGFVKDHNKALKNLSATVENEFCSIILTALDGRPIPGSKNLLLVATARSANAGMIWNEERTSLSNWGSSPTVIEPVRGKVVLRNLEPSQQINIIPLDGSGKALGYTVSAHSTKGDFILSIGEQATTWYLVRIQR